MASPVRSGRCAFMRLQLRLAGSRWPRARTAPRRHIHTDPLVARLLGGVALMLDVLCLIRDILQAPLNDSDFLGKRFQHT